MTIFELSQKQTIRDVDRSLFDLRYITLRKLRINSVIIDITYHEIYIVVRINYKHKFKYNYIVSIRAITLTGYRIIDREIDLVNDTSKFIMLNYYIRYLKGLKNHIKNSYAGLDEYWFKKPFRFCENKYRPLAIKERKIQNEY